MDTGLCPNGLPMVLILWLDWLGYILSGVTYVDTSYVDNTPYVDTFLALYK